MTGHESEDLVFSPVHVLGHLFLDPIYACVRACVDAYVCIQKYDLYTRPAIQPYSLNITQLHALNLSFATVLPRHLPKGEDQFHQGSG